MAWCATAISIEQATETLAIHYYMHDCKGAYSLLTPLKRRRNLAPEYFRKNRGKEYSVPTFHPREGDEACENDIIYSAYEILAAGFEMEKGSKPGRVNIPRRVLENIAKFNVAATAILTQRAARGDPGAAGARSDENATRQARAGNRKRRAQATEHDDPQAVKAPPKI